MTTPPTPRARAEAVMKAWENEHGKMPPQMECLVDRIETVIGAALEAEGIARWWPLFP